MSHDWTLVIGNKNYSSWSLRAWLALRQADIPFAEQLVALDTPTSDEDILRHSPAGRVPVLHDGDLTIWDSLAICEYAAECYPDRGLWPDEPAPRARARSLCAEMHAGFAALRTDLPMNCRARRLRRPRRAEVERDIARILACWAEARREYGGDGPFLFGRFTIVDAYFAPVASRFFTYDVALDDAAHAYQAALFAVPALQEWMRDAEREPMALPETDSVE